MAGEDTVLLIAALAGVGATLLMALRRPVLTRLGLRNFGRRRGETVIVILGLMIGTAIISSSLVTGDSTSHGIRKNVYDGLGEIDEVVAISGNFYFPQSAFSALAADPALQGKIDAASPMILQSVAVTLDRTGQSESVVDLQAFDPVLDRPFGGFEAQGTTRYGDELATGGVYINERLANALDAQEGDTLSVSYGRASSPLIPVLFNFSGNLVLATGTTGPDGNPSYTHAPNDEYTFGFDVGRDAAAISVILAWPPQAATDLDLELLAPGGSRVINGNGTATAPDLPVVLNVSGPVRQGDWSANVHAKSARNQPFVLRVLVFYEVYDFETAKRMVDDLRREAGGEAERVEEALRQGPTSEKRNVTITRIVEDKGKGNQFISPSVFMRLDDAQTMLLQAGRINLIKVTNPGGVEEGATTSTAAASALNASLETMKAADASPAVKSLRVVTLKANYLAAADRAGELFSQLLTLLGSFTILAGLMLIVNIFVMLSEERKTELGISRAIGLKQGDLVLMLLTEGLVYAVAAAAVGTIVGLGLSYALLQAFNGIWASNISLTIPFHPRLESMVLAFAAGILMSIAAILFTATRVSRLNVVRAIRQLDDPPGKSGPNTFLLGVTLAACGAGVTVYGVVANAFSSKVIGPPVALFGLLLSAGRFTADKRAVPLMAAAIFAYTLWTVFSVPPAGGVEGIAMGPARGLVLVLSATALIVSGRTPLEALARPLLRSRRDLPVVRVASSYPLQKRFRTGLTVAMFALVILVVMLFSILFSVLTPDLKEQSGGYDVLATSTVPTDDLAAHLRGAGGDATVFQGVSSVTNTLYADVPGGTLITISGKPVRYRGPPEDRVYGVDAAFRDTADFSYEEILPGYASQREVHDALVSRMDVIVISRIYTFDENNQPGGHHVGEILTMDLPGGARNFTVIGIQSQVYYQGVFVGKDALKRDFNQLHGQYLMKVASGVDAKAKAKDLEAAFKDIGLDAVSIDEDVANYIAETRQLYTLFQVYLGLGLVVGVASLGVVTARAVIERRQEMGMLRAIGFTRKMIQKAFVMEAVLSTSLGIFAGLLIGIVVAYGVYEQSLKQLGIAFSLPVVDMAFILVVAYVATFITTYWPARGASRISPAEAIRYIE
ncbi:MAG: FtsX-like permease family protein [Euryarchaeota archaeon]|nr:FtsX-like permease family protein [Euryarchaeota archaeon]